MGLKTSTQRRSSVHWEMTIFSVIRHAGLKTFPQQVDRVNSETLMQTLGTLKNYFLSLFRVIKVHGIEDCHSAKRQGKTYKKLFHVWSVIISKFFQGFGQKNIYDCSQS